MLPLLLGLAIFLSVHSVRIVADDWRRAQRARMGEWPWQAAYSWLSLAGLALMVWGYGVARAAPVHLWSPPPGMRHLAALLTLGSFILLAAAYVPGNAIKARLHHPMLAGVKLWALAHLLANGNLADVMLFGSLLAWAILCFRACRARERAEGTLYRAGSAGATTATVIVGIVAWAGFAFYLHRVLIGVRPFG